MIVEKLNGSHFHNLLCSFHQLILINSVESRVCTLFTDVSTGSSLIKLYNYCNPHCSCFHVSVFLSYSVIFEFAENIFVRVLGPCMFWGLG